MDNKLYDIKRKVLDYMEQEAGKYGAGRMDVKMMGELADVVKDLAEAEYYCSVSEAMGSQSGYGGGMGYGGGQGGNMGYGGGNMNQVSSGRQGYGGGMGHTDPVSTVREMLANPEMREIIRNEMR